MQYFLLALTFLIALSSSFFECVKKETSGRPILKHGLPIATRAGKITLVILVLSLAFSAINTGLDSRKSRKKEGELQKRLEKVSGQNDGLLDQINRLQVQNDELRKDQDANQKESLKAQQDSAVRTAKEIESSASLLHHDLATRLYEIRDFVVLMAWDLTDRKEKFFVRSGHGSERHPDTDEALAVLFCDQSWKTDKVEFRVSLASNPDIDYLITKKTTTENVKSSSGWTPSIANIDI